jgi:hypothetical protein
MQFFSCLINGPICLITLDTIIRSHWIFLIQDVVLLLFIRL